MIDESLDIEVGRYALRTFKIDEKEAFKSSKFPFLYGRPRLHSIFHDYIWKSGAIEAECLRNPTGFWEEICPKSPGKSCSCGIYGTTNLESLWAQYPAPTNNSVAVFAAEGETIIGDRGLRTAAARIVAYWCPNESKAKAYEVCQNARRYTSLELMLKDYKFPSDPDLVHAIETPSVLNTVTQILKFLGLQCF